MTKSVKSHWALMMAGTMLSGAIVSRCRPTAGKWWCTSLQNTLWSSFAAAMPSEKYPGTILVTSATRHQNASSSSSPARTRNAAWKFMLCT